MDYALKPLFLLFQRLQIDELSPVVQQRFMIRRLVYSSIILSSIKFVKNVKWRGVERGAWKYLLCSPHGNRDETNTDLLNNEVRHGIIVSSFCCDVILYHSGSLSSPMLGQGFSVDVLVIVATFFQELYRTKQRILGSLQQPSTIGL